MIPASSATRIRSPRLRLARTLACEVTPQISLGKSENMVAYSWRYDCSWWFSKLRWNAKKLFPTAAASGSEKPVVPGGAAQCLQTN